MKINDFIKACRERSELSQVKAALAVGVDRVTFSNWETGAGTPSLEHVLQVITKVAGVNPLDCFTLPLESDGDALDVIRDTLARGGEDRERVLEQVFVWRMRAENRQKALDRKHHRSPESKS